MSPRRSDPRARPGLVTIAARLLAEEGPQALSTRRIASEVGTSTMALYTHFNGMRGLARAIVHEGFARLQQHFTRVRPSDDPVCDLALLGRAYRCNAQANPHLYAVMFGGSSLAGFSLDEEDRQYGRYTLAGVTECAARCIGAGRFRPADPELVAHQMWSAVHGLVVLELGGYLIEPCDADRLLEAQLVGLMVGVGDTREAAAGSVAASARRLREEVVPAVDAAGPE
ncbi:TetR/AcrR family transcriptional regulator [Kitasatospora sp. NPDC057512]|uniref:TetR/AcrR family transcriptional regulator n=1 Tax=Kitasatospora sp. NPDC057512 TaxID=3346154 RepID=UPI003676F229